MSAIDVYYNSVYQILLDVQGGSAKINSLHKVDIENLKENASVSLHELFKKQDKATYDFFFSVAQKFLFVVLSLLATMVFGLIAVSKAKKRDYKAALNLKESKQSMENARQKVRDVAYTDILTGFKNRHALFEYLSEHMKDNFSIALYKLHDINKINASYGRNVTDEFISSLAGNISREFGSQAELFSTADDEFCVIFNNDIIRARTSVIAQNLLIFLSSPIDIENVQIGSVATGCLCYNDAKQYSSVDNLFLAMDRSIAQAREQHKDNILVNISQIVPN